MNKESFSFQLNNKYAPDEVIKKMLKQIEQATEGYVIGNIKEYEGPIYSYTRLTGIAVQFAAIQQEQDKGKVDIQKKLGDLSGKSYRYEVFLTVKGMEYYKYRMMFVDYGAISYPVTIVMDERLAAEYSDKKQDTFHISSMKELEKMLDIILNSDTMISFIQQLIEEALRQENRDNEGV